MGLTFTKLFARLFSKKEMRILMVSCWNAYVPPSRPSRSCLKGVRSELAGAQAESRRVACWRSRRGHAAAMGVLVTSCVGQARLLRLQALQHWLCQF